MFPSDFKLLGATWYVAVLVLAAIIVIYPAVWLNKKFRAKFPERPNFTRGYFLALLTVIFGTISIIAGLISLTNDGGHGINLFLANIITLLKGWPVVAIAAVGIAYLPESQSRLTTTGPEFYKGKQMKMNTRGSVHFHFAWGYFLTVTVTAFVLLYIVGGVLLLDSREGFGVKTFSLGLIKVGLGILIYKRFLGAPLIALFVGGFSEAESLLGVLNICFWGYNLSYFFHTHIERQVNDSKFDDFFV